MNPQNLLLVLCFGSLSAPHAEHTVPSRLKFTLCFAEEVYTWLLEMFVSRRGKMTDKLGMEPTSSMLGSGSPVTDQPQIH